LFFCFSGAVEKGEDQQKDESSQSGMLEGCIHGAANLSVVYSGLREEITVPRR
jgi:hypothetical protein